MNEKQTDTPSPSPELEETPPESTASDAPAESPESTATAEAPRPSEAASEENASPSTEAAEDVEAAEDLEAAEETTGISDVPLAKGRVGMDITVDELERQAEEIGVRADLLDVEDYTADEYEEMLSLYEDTLSDIAEGEIVRATVLRKTENSIILDVGFKSEGAVSLDEFREPETIQPGDEVEVFLESLEDQEGVVVLSKKKADFLRVWEKIKYAYDHDETVPGSLKRKIKGGVTVDLMGVDAFLPGSQIALRRVPNVDDLIGNEYRFKILKLNKRRRNIVVSRRVILEEERAEKRKQLKKELEVGQVRKGVVKNITDFGAFIDLGGMDGLLHITDMSWGRIGHPSEVCSIGDEMEIKILDIDWERERISLGYKQLQAYPWEDVAEKYPVGSRVKGRVVSITNYGAFVELEKGVEGLVHISEMSWTRNVRHPSQLVSINDVIVCVVLRVDEDEKKISLGMKQTEEDPWLALPSKYPAGTKIKGVVRNLTSFGAFVEVEPGIDGLVHISDMSWTRRVQHPSEVVRKGEEVEVLILNIDPEQKRISLGLKQVEEDPWYELAQQYEPGLETEGTVVRLLDKGLVVDLGDDVEGFVPISQLGVEEDIDEPADKFVEGDRLELKVLESDPINRRIVLQVIGAPGVEEREAAAEAEEAEEAVEPDDEAQPKASAEEEDEVEEDEGEDEGEEEEEAEEEEEDEAEGEEDEAEDEEEDEEEDEAEEEEDEAEEEEEEEEDEEEDEDEEEEEEDEAEEEEDEAEDEDEEEDEEDEEEKEKGGGS